MHRSPTVHVNVAVGYGAIEGTDTLISGCNLLGALEELVLVLQEGSRSFIEEQWDINAREVCLQDDDPPPHTVTVYGHLDLR
eukprot:1177597-Prorocentrum_minimum.AAC.5